MGGIWRGAYYNMCDHRNISTAAVFNSFFQHSFSLHRLENRTRPISTSYDRRPWWDSNLRTPTCESPPLYHFATAIRKRYKLQD